MATFLIAIRNAQMRVHSAQLLARLARESGGNVAHERLRMRHTAADNITLRGIPAIGEGVQGVIFGTRPDGICNRDI